MMIKHNVASARRRGEPAFEIDVGKLAEKARFDGIFVLRTNADVTPLQAVLRYRELVHAEQFFQGIRCLKWPT
jgi:hypothetical protein